MTLRNARGNDKDKDKKMIEFCHLQEISTCCNPSLPFSVSFLHTACVINKERHTCIVLITTHTHTHKTHESPSRKTRPTAFHSFRRKDIYIYIYIYRLLVTVHTTYVMALSVTQAIKNRIVGRIMNGKLESASKKVAVV